MSELNKEQRRHNVEQARANQRIEGLHPTPQMLDDDQDYIEGRRTNREIIEDIKKEYRNER